MQQQLDRLEGKFDRIIKAKNRKALSPSPVPTVTGLERSHSLPAASPGAP